MNLVRMNLYRFFKSKSFYVFLIITISFVAMVIIMKKVNDNMAPDKQFIAQEVASEEENDVGITVGVGKLTDVYEVCNGFLGSGLIMMFIAIFVVMYTNAERASGYLKNLTTLPYSRTLIVLSKIVPILLFVTIEILAVCITSLLLGLQVKDFPLLMKYVMIQWLLSAAFGMMNVFIMEVFRSLTAGLLIGICVSLGLGLAGMMYFESFLQNVLGNSNIGISNHLLVAFVRGIDPSNITKFAIPAIISALIGLAGYTGLSVLITHKRDMY